MYEMLIAFKLNSTLSAHMSRISTHRIASLFSDYLLLIDYIDLNTVQQCVENISTPFLKTLSVVKVICMICGRSVKSMQHL
jgi:hypothetical protein